MEKVTIIGNGGAGKSSLALALGEQKNLPVFHLDQYIWKANWQAVAEDEFLSCHHNILSGEKWIIEGLGYNSSIEERFQHSDTIIFIDFPIQTHMTWAIRRSIKSIYKRPKGWAEGCQPIRKLPYILRIIWHVHRNTRRFVLDLVKKYQPLKTIYHIQSPANLQNFYNTKVHC